MAPSTPHSDSLVPRYAPSPHTRTYATYRMASAVDTTSQPDPLASPKLRKADDAELGLVRPDAHK